MAIRRFPNPWNMEKNHKITWDEIVEFKPEFGPLKLNIVALFKRLTVKPQKDSAAIVARRFLQVFQDHGVPVTQIPRLVPQLTIDDCSSQDQLLSALKSEILEQTAELFQIRLAWLEGVGDQIYDTVSCYKVPEQFFQELAALDTSSVVFPIVALCDSKNLDCNNDKAQSITLLFREKLCDLDDNEIHRYRIWDDGWDWGYWKCRIQLKAMARMVDKILQNRIPMYLVKPKSLKFVESGKCVPRPYLQCPQLKNVSLEDFALSPWESHQSKEAEELSAVIEYINFHKLENSVRDALGLI